ncbi:hypothetical protein F4804DRAFT_343408 [Jackrogersella minutella]|nr:hypothetical protein F4804DRAFT_343408 [Jackrogersella minutella]
METVSPLNAIKSRSTSALGGRACTNCARVKCKCIHRADGTVCERCYRLKKQCIASVSVGRRATARRGISRTAQLEKKLDELVTRLKAQQGPESQETGDGLDGPGEQTEHDSDTGDPSITVSTPTIAANGPENPPGSSSTYPDEPSPSEAEELLKIFREDTIGFFPFVYIPPHVTSQQLREHYPFLWLNIIATKLVSPKRRLSLSDQVKNIVVQKVVVDREKSLDLLLGLLTLVGWSHRQRRDKPFWTLFSQLIVTLVCDLGLHAPQPEINSMFCALGKDKDNDSRISNVFRMPTHEVQRAALGAFVLTSTISNIFKHAPGLRWSSHFDSYLENLAQDSTVSQDETLIALVRMQLIINQIYNDPHANSGGSPPALYLSALRSQLHEITSREKLGTTVRNHPIVLEQYHFAELLINESAIRKSPTPWNEPDLGRFEVYQSCLMSIKAYLDTFFSTPVTLFDSMPFTSFPQVVRVMKCLHTITTVEDPAWDRAAVRRSVDLISTCDKILETLEYLKATSILAAPDDGEDETHNRGIVVFRKLKEAWLNELSYIDTVDTTTGDNSMTDGTQNGEDIIATDFMQFSGDPWFFGVMYR